MRMKINYFLTLPIALLLFITSCDKDEVSNPNLDDQGVSFVMNTNSNLKAANCFSKLADYANIVINNKSYKVPVFYLNSTPYTNTIKLAVGNYTLSEFILMDDNNTPDNADDDVVIAATPHAGSEFAQYVNQPLNISFSVEAFKKTELGIEVLCYQESEYSSFGFVFHQIGQVVVREQFFFGDICIKSLSDYDGSIYMNQSTGLQQDMPAIAKIEVFRNGLKKGEFSNESWYGEGQPLTVRYADVLGQIDNFEFKLFILVKKGSGFDYVYFHSWKFADAETIPNGGDGVVEFVLGNCLQDADLILPPWMNLPPTATYTITGWNPPTLGGYVDVTLSNVTPGYEMINGLYPSICADHNAPIFILQNYQMSLYSSLYQNQLPAFAQSGKWEKINWLYNHLDWYPGYHWYDIQGFVWLYDTPAWNGLPNGSVPAITDLTKKMKADADKYGVEYKVPSGGWAAVIFIPVGNTSSSVQTMFIQVDP
jgi:hypothetical protein